MKIAQENLKGFSEGQITEILLGQLIN